MDKVKQLERDIAQRKANIERWKQNIEIESVVVKALESELKKASK